MNIPHAKFKALYDYLQEMDDKHALVVLAGIKSDYDAMAAKVPSWRPIGTAPDDETDILLYSENRGIEIGYFHSGLEWGRGSDPVNSWVSIDFEAGDRRINATHWQPLPEPPKE